MGKGWWKSLYVQVLLAIVAGILLGYFDPGLGAAMKPLGDAFIALVKMIIGPVIFLTVVVGIAHMGDLRQVGRVGMKALVYFEVLTTIALLIGLARRQPGQARRRHDDRPGVAGSGGDRRVPAEGRSGRRHRRLPPGHHSAHVRLGVHRGQPAAGAVDRLAVWHRDNPRRPRRPAGSRRPGPGKPCVLRRREPDHALRANRCLRRDGFHHRQVRHRYACLAGLVARFGLPDLPAVRPGGARSGGALLRILPVEVPALHPCRTCCSCSAHRHRNRRCPD